MYWIKHIRIVLAQINGGKLKRTLHTSEADKIELLSNLQKYKARALSFLYLAAEEAAILKVKKSFTNSKLDSPYLNTESSHMSRSSRSLGLIRHRYQ